MHTGSQTLYKLILLTMLEQVSYALPNAILSDFLLEREYTGYFNIQRALSELCEEGLITKEQTYNRSFYKLTTDGKETCRLFGHTLEPDIINDIKSYLKKNHHEIVESLSIYTDYKPVRDNEYEANCKLMEKDTPLLNVSLTLPTEEEAARTCTNFREKSASIYSFLLRELL